MIKVILRGGLGNQMFQYAAGRRLALLHRCELELDITRYRTAPRAYLLDRFPIVARVSNPYLAGQFEQIFGRPLWRLTLNSIYFEQNHRFDPELVNHPVPFTLVGWFQSVRYFDSIAPLIRKELVFQEEITDRETLDIEQNINDSIAISVHVRRTDYVGKVKFQVCSPGYYHQAMEYYRQQLPHPHFFVFSDDAEWCRAKFKNPDTTVVDLIKSRFDPLNDMRLMSACRHHIIANSSYSWWGAWLNDKADKQVVAPHVWFNEPDVPIEDKLCTGWIKMGEQEETPEKV